MSLRSLLPKLASFALIAAAAIGFWILSNGMSAGSASITGYAEERLHQVGSLQTGRIKSLLVSLGQSVRVGDVVATLDTRLLELERDRLRASIAKAQAQLTAQEDIERSQLQRSQLQAVRTFADEQRSRAELRELNKRLSRLQALQKEQLVRATDVEVTRQRQQALAADLAARPMGSARSLALMGMRPRPSSDQEARLADRLAPFRAALAVEEAALHKVEQEITEMTLRAPVDGVVSVVVQQVGDVVRAGMPVITLTTTRPGVVVAYVPERQARRIQVGDRVMLRRYATLQGRLDAHVVETAPNLEQAPLRLSARLSLPFFVRRIVVRLDTPQALLPGESFYVTLR